MLPLFAGRAPGRRAATARLRRGHGRRNSRGAQPPRSKPGAGGTTSHHGACCPIPLPPTRKRGAAIRRFGSPVCLSVTWWRASVALAQHLGVQAAQDQPAPHGAASTGAQWCDHVAAAAPHLPPPRPLARLPGHFLPATPLNRSERPPGPPYRDAVTAVLPDAQIVIDKFHVVRMANDAVEKVRKSLREQLTPKQRRGLMHDRFVLLKRERDLNDKERLLLDGWTKNYSELGAAYRLKEGFYGIYEGSGSPQAAIAAYEAWNKAVVPEVRDAYSDLIRAWTNWQPWILGYFDHPVTNAYTESLNSLIRVMNRLGRGYSFEALQAKVLFTEGAHKKTLARPKFERRREPVAVDFAAEDVMGYGVPGQGMEELARMMVRTTGKTPETHETAEPAKNYGADITTLTELIESGKI